MVCRHHTVDAGRTILEGKPEGLPDPFQIDDVAQRRQCHSSLWIAREGSKLPHLSTGIEIGRATL